MKIYYFVYLLLAFPSTGAQGIGPLRRKFVKIGRPKLHRGLWGVAWATNVTSVTIRWDIENKRR